MIQAMNVAVARNQISLCDCCARHVKSGIVGIPCHIGKKIVIVFCRIDHLGVEIHDREHRQKTLLVKDGNIHLTFIVVLDGIGILAFSSMLVVHAGVDFFLFIRNIVALFGTKVDEFICTVCIVHQVETNKFIQLGGIHFLYAVQSLFSQIEAKGRIVRCHYRYYAFAVYHIVKTCLVDSFQKNGIIAIHFEDFVAVSLDPVGTSIIFRHVVIATAYNRSDECRQQPCVSFPME